MKLLRKKSNYIWVLIYGFFYMISFICLERSNAQPHLIHSVVDEYIPFCKYFIIPYVLWFGFIAASFCYFAFVCEEKREFYQFMGIMGAGLTAFIIISFVYPNGQELRPALGEGGIFIQAVKLLYRLDTPTNILPSMHVFCYLIFYKFIPLYQKQLLPFLTKKEILTIPNILSFLRLMLAVLFLGITQRGGMEENKDILAAILIISGISDFLDGKIARKFNMTSEMGKIIDPIADKVTQAVLLLCLFSRYSFTKWIFVLLVIKEGCMAVVGTRTVLQSQKNEGAKWYGKVNTAVFYVVMAAFIMFRNISGKFADILLGCCGGCMLLAFIMYIRQFYILRKQNLGAMSKEDRTACF